MHIVCLAALFREKSTLNTKKSKTFSVELEELLSDIYLLSICLIRA